MIVTNYVCDRCNQPVGKNKLFRITLTARRLSNGLTTTPAAAQQTTDWCKSCYEQLTETKIPNDSDNPKPVPIFTLEDLVREIVDEEIDRKL